MAHTNTDESKKIPLGSGEVYVTVYNGTLPTDSVLETEANRLGYIQGGASVEYKPTRYTAKDDLNKVSKSITTDEEATFKLGLITWNANTLSKLTATGTVTETSGKRTIKIGGIANQNYEKYVFRFVHKDPVDGDIRITVVGSNEAGFVLAFAKDKESTINPEIKCEPQTDGTLIVYEEEILSSATTSTAKS